MKLAIIGAGWAGLAAAVQATASGHDVTVFEAAHAIGGRARAVPGALPDGTPVLLDNGQHILIGAYRETLRLLEHVGVDLKNAFVRRPMTLLFPDRRGLHLPDWPAPLDALAGILTAGGWGAADKWSLLRLAGRWQWQRFQCAEGATVAQLCQGLSPRVMAELIEPLCVSALNTPAPRASAQVFLRVLQDALFGASGSSNLLLPRLDLSELFPNAAARWLARHDSRLLLGARVEAVQARGPQWQVRDECFDAVIVATPAWESIRLLERSADGAGAAAAGAMQQWIEVCSGLKFDTICTVYAWSASATLAQPMLALRSSSDPGAPAPAQFVFDRAQLGGPDGLLAFVVSASQGERATLQAQVLVQAQRQLGLQLQAIQTLVEKRATFACTPDLRRPGHRIATGLLACGDYVAGPYPATLEGAVRSALDAVQQAAPGTYDAVSETSTSKEPQR